MKAPNPVSYTHLDVYKRQWLRGTAVTSDEFGAIARHVNRNAVGRRSGGERDPPGKFAIAVFGQQRARCSVLFNRQLPRMVARQHAQHQAGVAEQRQSTGLIAAIAQPNPGDFDLSLIHI